MLHILELKHLVGESFPQVYEHRYPNNVDGHFDLSKVFQDIQDIIENPVDCCNVQAITLYIERKKS